MERAESVRSRRPSVVVTNLDEVTATLTRGPGCEGSTPTTSSR